MNVNESPTYDHQEAIRKRVAESIQRLTPIVAIQCPSCGSPIGTPCSLGTEVDELGRWHVHGKRMAKAIGREDLYWLYDGVCVMRLPDELLNASPRTAIMLNGADLVVAPGGTIEVTECTRNTPFRPERLFVYEADGWTINDVAINNMSQFIKVGMPHEGGPTAIPARLFAIDILDAHRVWIDDMDIASVITIVVTRDLDAAPSKFLGGMLGIGGEDRRTLTEEVPSA